jgi:hypothetical protein
VVELPDRSFGADPAAAFTAAHELRERFDAAAAEPDLPTAFFPEDAERGDGEDPGQESVEAFPPGCWAPPDPALDTDPQWALRAIGVPQRGSSPRRAGGRSAATAWWSPNPTPASPPTRSSPASSGRAGWDVLDGDADPTDPLGAGNPGHGTATASVLVSPGRWS